MTDHVATRGIEPMIRELRGQRVMFDSDLARLYGVQTKALNRAVSRNRRRFPPDFMFRLNIQEFDELRFHSGTSSLRSQSGTSGSHGGRRHLPYAFTEQGVAMLSSVLRSERAIQVNVEIMRTFVLLRRMAGSHADLARRLDALEAKYDVKFKEIFDAIRELMEPPPARSRPRIGFGA